MLKSILAISLGVIAILPVAGSATEDGASDSPLIVYRDAHGRLTPAASASVAEMLRRAARNGSVNLRLLLNYPIDLYIDEDAKDEIEAQNLAVRLAFEQILDPLIARGTVWHPKSGPSYWGPGCSVEATGAGVSQLVADDRILQIVAVEQARGD